MTKKITSLALFLVLGLNSYGQESNVIIQVNDKLIMEGLANIFVKLDFEGKSRSFSVDYSPGRLKMSKKVWAIIMQDSIGKFDLHFDYYTFKNQKVKIINFRTGLSKGLLKNDYLVVNIYDFRNRKYRKWYGPYTDEEYLVELRYPNGPKHIRYE